MSEFRLMKQKQFFQPHGSKEWIEITGDVQIVFAPSYMSRRTDLGIYVDRTDSMAGVTTTYGPFASDQEAEDAEIILRRHDERPSETLPYVKDWLEARKQA